MTNGISFFSILIILLSLVGTSSAFANIKPERFWKYSIAPHFDAHETGLISDGVKSNIQSFGRTELNSQTTVQSPIFDKYFNDNANLAALVTINDKLVYTRFDTTRNITSRTPLHGMSMSKTAIGAVVGSLLCDGKISSLDDEIGDYSERLKATAYADISIRNVLQMNSGITPKKRGDIRDAINIAIGRKEFKNNASVLNAVKHFPKKLRKQGQKHNYHGADTFALSVLISDITGKSAAQVFYENIYQNMNTSGQMHWVADNEDITVSLGYLTMNAFDWHSFGQFVLEQLEQQSCLGNFFEDGIKRAIPTSRRDVGYGYQFWVYKIDGEPALTMTGVNGYFNVVRQSKKAVMSIFSIKATYRYGNLFEYGVLSRLSKKITN